MPNRILVPLIVACALFMENLDSTVISTALPAIAADFGSSPIHLKLAMTSYLLTLAVFLPASGWLADRLGARLIFRLAIVTFTTGSILCGFSHSIGSLVFARIVQGIGGSMMVPVGRLVVLRTVSKAELVSSLAWLTVPALVGPVVGPPVGGFITTYVSWPWIFWINIPVGILGFILASLYIPEVRGETRVPFDWLGFALSGLGLSIFMGGSTTLGLKMLSVPVNLLMIGLGFALLVGYVVHARRASNPILALSLLRIPSFRQTLFGSLIGRIGMGATPFLLPLLLQLGFGMNAFQSGTITFASAVGAIAMKFGAPPLLKRFGFRNVLLANTLVSSAFVALPALFTPATPVLLLTVLLLIGGFFRSLQFTSISALAFADVPQQRMSQATTMTSVAQQISVSLGITVGAIALEVSTEATGGAIVWTAFWWPFAIVGALSVISLIPFLKLHADAGFEISGRQPTPDPVTAMRDRG
jgi:EmrB/QacA subfamily drug resistance transporter